MKIMDYLTIIKIKVLNIKYIKFIIKNINILIQDKYVIIKKIKLYINCNLLKK